MYLGLREKRRDFSPISLFSSSLFVTPVKRGRMRSRPRGRKETRERGRLTSAVDEQDILSDKAIASLNEGNTSVNSVPAGGAHRAVLLRGGQKHVVRVLNLFTIEREVNLERVGRGEVSVLRVWQPQGAGLQRA
jgi:hypothetical protein